MKITAIRCTPLRVPRRQAFRSSLGTDTHSENAVVEIETDAGITGIGEVSTIWGSRARGETEVLRSALAPRLIGADPFRIEELAGRMEETVARSEPARAGIEMALHDIVGKELGTPVYNLLGGRVHDEIPLSHSLSMGPSAEVAAQARELAGRGYRTLKVKVGRDLDADRSTVEAVRREVGGSIALRVDANMGWTSHREAVRAIRELEAFDLELVEQPLKREDLDGLRRIREEVHSPIMADESVWTAADALECIRRGAADVFNVYVSEAGGLRAAAKIFTLAEAAGIPCIVGSMPELGIGTAAQAHLAFAMRNIGFACDLNGVEYHAADVIRETLPIRGASILPPGGPGLGVTLDRDALERYRMD